MVDLFFRNPNSFSVKKFLFSRNSVSFEVICFSSSFPGIGSRDMGLKSVGCEALGFFGIGVTVAIFHLSGKIVEHCYFT